MNRVHRLSAHSTDRSITHQRPRKHAVHHLLRWPEEASEVWPSGAGEGGGAEAGVSWLIAPTATADDTAQEQTPDVQNTAYAMPSVARGKIRGATRNASGVFFFCAP